MSYLAVAFYSTFTMNSSIYLPFVYSHRSACLGGHFDFFSPLISFSKKKKKRCRYENSDAHIIYLFFLSARSVFTSTEHL